MRVKYSADTRYSECMIATHTGQTRDAYPVTTLAELGEMWRDYDVIGIDEG